MKTCLYVLFFAISGIVLVQCANPIPPAGGLKDEQPPTLVEEASTPNLQTNFQKQRIELTFDEWVVVEDIFNQVVVSPPLEFRPKITLKRKTVRFDFDERETLRPEATYTINFGLAVKDLTEKNPADNLRFVFSTGDYIDSLKVEGEIVDARKGEPVEGVLFMLYENLADSVVRVERPFYFAKTNKQGRFLIENVKAGIFKGFALKDIDFNYLFNLPNEQIGFPDSTFTVSDSLPPPFKIRLFEETPPLRLSESTSNRFGLVRLAFNQTPHQLELDYEDIGQTVIYEYEKDTVRVWYDQEGPESWNLYLRRDTTLDDTVRVNPPDKEAFLKETGFLQPAVKPASGSIKLNPSRSLRLQFNHPISAFDTSRILLFEDTLETRVTPVAVIDSASRRTLDLRFPWREGLPYRLELMPGAVRDLFGLENDTLRMKYLADSRKSYGNLILTLNGLMPDTNYVVQLLRGETPVEEFQVTGVETFKREFRTLDPGQYTLQVVADLNKNGRWDSGNYDLRQQPEPNFITQLEQLRANWDVESTVDLNQ
jgi:hypothetical protein